MLSDGRIAEYLLDYDPVGKAKYDYEERMTIGVDDFEQVLDAVMLGRGLDKAVRCPRCGTLVKGIGHTDRPGLIAVRCGRPGCFFVGYTELPVHDA